MLKIEILESVDYKEWNKLLLNSLDSTVFHTLEWMKVLHKTYPSRQSLYIIARNGSGEMMGGLALIRATRFGLHTLTTPSWGTPLVVDNAGEEVRQALLQRFSVLCERWNVVYASLGDYSMKCDSLCSLGFERNRTFTHILSLEPSLEYVREKKLTKYTRKNVRLSKKRGVTIKEISNMSQVKQYYDISVHTHMRRSGKPGYPFIFYQNIFDIMKGKGIAKWHLAEKDGTVLAGTLHFVYKDTVFDLLNASYSEFLDLKANFLLVWSMITWAAENGYRYYNFGGSPPEAKGLIEFKERWGAERKDFNIYIHKTNLFRLLQTIYRAGNMVKASYRIKRRV